jgi:hypothetical protein
MAVLMTFVQAYNVGHVAAALRLFDPAGQWSDCDYRRGQAIGGRGEASVQQGGSSQFLENVAAVLRWLLR